MPCCSSFGGLFAWIWVVSAVPLQHVLDLLHRLLGAPGQVAYFVRHHGETATLFAGPGGFDGGIERQQVGLFSNALDGPGNLGNLRVGVLNAVLFAQAQGLGGLFIADVAHGPDHPYQHAVGVIEAAPALAVPGFAAGLVAHAVLHHIGWLALGVGDVPGEYAHDLLQVLGGDYAEEAVPAIGKLGAAVADQVAKLIGPADDIVRVVGVAIDHAEVPAALGKGLLGQRPGLGVLLPLAFAGRVGMALFLAALHLLLQLLALAFAVGQLLAQLLILLGAAGGGRGGTGLLLELLVGVPATAQPLESVEQLRVAL